MGAVTQRAQDVILVVLIAAGPLVALRPLQDAPFVDDWTYAWSVEHLLQTGELRVLDWSTSFNVVQILWGALFCLPLGFSFTALRFSTWVASVLGLVGLYYLIRELGGSRQHALIGVALLWFYPIYFILSFTFMTDVPFLTAVTWSLHVLVRALARRSAGALFGAAVLAGLATAIRPIGIFLAGVMLVALALHSGGWGMRVRRFSCAAIPIVTLVLLMLAHDGFTVHRADLTWIQGSPAWRMANLKWGLLRLHEWLVMNLTFTIPTLGVALMPLAWGSLSAGNVRRGTLLALILGLPLLANAILSWSMAAPLIPGSTWSLRELGASRSLTGADPGRWIVPSWWNWASTVAGLLLLSVTVAPIRLRRLTVGAMILGWAGVGYFGLTTVLWLFYDRYVLPLVVLVLALRLAIGGPIRFYPAVAGMLVFACVGFVGTWDHLQYSKALWEAVGWARRMGISEREIDGGYVVNGWLQYAHPEHAGRAPNGDVLVPRINDDELVLRIGVVNSAPPGSRVLHAVPFRSVLAPPGTVYVVDRTPGQ